MVMLFALRIQPEKYYGNVVCSQNTARKILSWYCCLFCGITSQSTVNIRILHECQLWIDKSVPRVTFWHHEASFILIKEGSSRHKIRQIYIYIYIVCFSAGIDSYPVPGKYRIYTTRR